MKAERWLSLTAAAAVEQPRWPLFVAGVKAGSVARTHVDALAAWAQWIAVRDGAVHVEAVDLTAALASINAELRTTGLVVAWRDEAYPVLPAGARAGDPPLALIERAAARFWGTLTFGAHCNGYLADDHGQPTHLWIARRAATKATDPGKLDNLVGGGVPHGQMPFDTLVREGFEEAGLDAATMQRATAGSVLHLQCDIAEGFMNEHLHVFDLQLEAGMQPVNQDGEVDEWHCLSISEALACAAQGEMTMDAALVTLDFALRHRLLPAQQAETLALRLYPLILR